MKAEHPSTVAASEEFMCSQFSLAQFGVVKLVKSEVS
jgi:hypothetical protein